MHCSGCGKTIPFAGSVCPFCQRDKSKDQKYTVWAFIFGLGLAYLGGNLIGAWGAIGGFVIGCVIALVISGAGTTKPPEVQVTNVVATRSEDPKSSEARLAKLKSLRDKGLIGEAEYNEKKKEILDAL